MFLKEYLMELKLDGKCETLHCNTWSQNAFHETESANNAKLI